MARHCPVTGLVDCDCGACEPDEGETPPDPFAIRFQSPPGKPAST
jgi:hypothetical protein